MLEAVRELIRENASVEVTRTAYTVKVEGDREVYYFADGTFPARGFGAAGKARKDALAVHEKAPDGTDLWAGIPGSYPSRVKYYNVPTDTVLPKEAVCVDIRAAYPTTLRNLGIISQGAYGALMSLPKPARLKATGMMGTTKYISTYRNARPQAQRVEVSPTASAFFAACEHVGAVMQHAAQVSGTAFGLFWVDGIFVRPEAVDDVREVLEGAGYDTTVEPVENIRRSSSGRYIFYRKGEKNTYLCVPQRIEIDETEILKELKRC